MNGWTAGWLGCLCFLVTMNSFAEEPDKMALPGGVQVIFTPLNEARDMLAREDEFLQAMGPLDRPVRMKKASPTAAEWKAFLSAAAMEWKTEDKEAVRAALKRSMPMMEELHLGLPKEARLVKTSGEEEEKSAYTRGNAVFLPEPMIQGSATTLAHVLAHELCHVLTRAKPKLRDKLYAVLGFQPLPARVAYPAFLEPFRLTNPDAPFIEHAIKLHCGGQDVWAGFVLTLPRDKFDETTGSPGFKDMQLHLLPVDPKTGGTKAASMADLMDPREVTGLIEQAGSNTGYVIHPEEILADNLALLLLKREGVPSPEILEGLRKVLQADTP